MLLAARSESVNVVFPWSTCPQAVMFRVICEFDPIDERKKENERGKWQYLSATTCHSASSTLATSTPTAKDDDCPTV